VLVVSSGGPDAVVRSILSLAGAEVIVAPAGCSRAEMCDLGMKQATGAIVSVRDGADVGDGSWLMAYRSVVPWSAAPATTAAHERATPETVVLDTMVAAAVAGRADPPARRAQRIGLERPARESGGLAATI
jgi:predicted dinucleotide-binding enzyme